MNGTGTGLGSTPFLRCILSVCVAVYHLDDKSNISHKIFLPQISRQGQTSHAPSKH